MKKEEGKDLSPDRDVKSLLAAKVSCCLRKKEKGGELPKVTCPG